MFEIFPPRWVLKYFYETASEVPAYKAFLAERKIYVPGIRSANDFVSRVPFTSKKNYIARYVEDARLNQRELWRPIYASSGSTGTPTFWRLSTDSAKYGLEAHERLFKGTYGIRPTEPTLLVVCFGMGIWIAGTFTAQVGSYLAQKGWRMSTVTPGLDELALGAILSQFPEQYRHIVLAGFPSYIARMVRQHRKLIHKSKAQFKALLAAEPITEEFRDELLDNLGSSTPTDVASIYGSADAGVMGFESPVTIGLLRMAKDNTALRRTLLQDNTQLPALYQYDDRSIFFEQEGGELAFTARSASPLIRYNIRDVGEVVTSKTLAMLARTARVPTPAGFLGLPAVTYRSRTDVALLYHAINLTASQLGGWFLPKYHELLYGYFAFTKRTNNGLGEQLCIRLAAKKQLSYGVKNNFIKLITNKLLVSSTELRKVYDTFGKRALPQFAFVTNVQKLYKPGVQHGLLHLGGKKARVV